MLIRKKTFWFLILLLLSPTQTCPASHQTSKSPSQLISQTLSHPFLKGAKVGVSIKLAKTGKEIFSYHSHLPLLPASNMKLLTSASALSILGPTFSFTTKVLGAPPEDGVVKGNIYLVGSGDPSWRREFFPSPLTPLASLARQMAQEGIREVTGEVVADDRAFDREFVGRGWRKRYQDEEYSAEVSALSLHANIVHLGVIPGPEPGATARVTIWPPNDAITIVNEVLTSRSITSLSMTRSPKANRIVLRGRVWCRSPGEKLISNVHVPPLFAASALVHLLRKEGIRVHGRVRLVNDGEEVSEPHILALVRSPPLKEIARVMNKVSDNSLAEHVMKTLGYLVNGKGSLEEGATVVNNWARERGINPEGVVIADGSGLSPFNRLNAGFLADLLSRMTSEPCRSVFFDTLPQGGEKDTTLEDRLSGVAVRGKTGSLAEASALSGYVMTAGGQLLAFSMLVNDYKTSPSAIKKVEDAIITYLAVQRTRWNEEGVAR